MIDWNKKKNTDPLYGGYYSYYGYIDRLFRWSIEKEDGLFVICDLNAEAIVALPTLREAKAWCEKLSAGPRIIPVKQIETHWANGCEIVTTRRWYVWDKDYEAHLATQSLEHDDFDFNRLDAWFAKNAIKVKHQ